MKVINCTHQVARCVSYAETAKSAIVDFWMAASLAAWSVPSCSIASWRMFCGGFRNSRLVNLCASRRLGGSASSHVKSSQSMICRGYPMSLKNFHQKPRGGYSGAGSFLGGSGSIMTLLRRVELCGAGSCPNYWMADSFVEYVICAMGDIFVEYERGWGFMAVAFGAKRRHSQLDCRI
jgi:hypothetical protein